jgi:hypothetical protein
LDELIQESSSVKRKSRGGSKGDVLVTAAAHCSIILRHASSHLSVNQPTCFLYCWVLNTYIHSAQWMMRLSRKNVLT